MPFTASEYKLPGLLLLEGKSFPDDRGFFMESFRVVDVPQLPPLIQDNLSRTKKGWVRGLHYQKNPSAIGKLVRCLRGRIFDVAVDLRKGSPTYGKWASIELSDEGNTMFWVPAGFAHGFQALSDEADVMYKVTGYWEPKTEGGVLWSDPALAIPWPLPARANAKDAVLPTLASSDANFTWNGR